MTKIHFCRKKFEAFPQLKIFAAKLKAQKNSMQKFKSVNKGEFDTTVYKK